MSSTTPTKWVVVLPVKPLREGKSRLSPLGVTARRTLLSAFLRDTLTAVVGTRDVIETFVVSVDDEILQTGLRHGAKSIADPGEGLSAAVEAAADACRAGEGDRGFAVVPADLPCLTSAVLTDLLRAASSGTDPWFFVPDVAGSGTTVLAAPRARPVACYGAGSAIAHAAAGGVPLIARRRARLDVDTPADLQAALQVGVGSHTAAALESRGSMGRPGEASLAERLRAAVGADFSSAARPASSAVVSRVAL